LPATKQTFSTLTATRITPGADRRQALPAAGSGSSSASASHGTAAGHPSTRSDPLAALSIRSASLHYASADCGALIPGVAGAQAERNDLARRQEPTAQNPRANLTALDARPSAPRGVVLGTAPARIRARSVLAVTCSWPKKRARGSCSPLGRFFVWAKLRQPLAKHNPTIASGPTVRHPGPGRRAAPRRRNTRRFQSQKFRNCRRITLELS